MYDALDGSVRTCAHLFALLSARGIRTHKYMNARWLIQALLLPLSLFESKYTNHTVKNLFDHFHRIVYGSSL